MLKAVFYKQGNDLTGFSVSGHAGYGTEGNDIVCAAISSNVMLVCNTVTEFFKAEADVEVKENEIILLLKEDNAPAKQLLASFFQHMEIIAEEHRKIKLETRITGG